MPKKRITNFNEELDLGLMLTITRKSLIWVILLLMAGAFVAFIYLRYTPAVYSSNAVVKLGTENISPSIRLLNIGGAKNNDSQIAGEIEIIRSNLIIGRALAKMPLKVSYFSKGTVLVNEMYTLSPFIVECTLTDSTSVYGIPFYIEFSKDNTYTLSTNLKDRFTGRKYRVGEWIQQSFGSLKVIITNPWAVQQDLNKIKHDTYFFTINNQSTLISTMVANVSVQVLNEQAQTIQIGYKDNNPLKTADFVNAIATEFIAYDYDKKAEGSKKVLSFVDETLENVNIELRNSEARLEQFKKNNKLLNPEAVANSVLGKMNELENKKIVISLEQSVFNKIEENIEKNTDLNNLIPILAESNFSNSIVSSIITNINSLQADKEKMLLQVTPQSEQIKIIDARIAAQKKLLIESVRNAKKGIDEKKEEIEKNIADFSSSFDQLPAKQAEYIRLTRLFSINERFYSQLLEKKVESAITKVGIVPDNIILQTAVPDNKPISPNRRMIMLTCIIASLALGLMLIIARYFLHNVITSLEEIEQYTEAALLGIIPKYKKEIPVSQLLVDKNPKAAISEAFRSVRTNLQFISNDSESKVMAITSTISGEGKTFVAINLGGIIAFSDKKVIILDLDMRKPKIHVGFGVENLHGMSTLLIGKDLPEDCINKSSLENLDFITAGPIPPNPSELIIGKKMDELLDYLKTIYDIIIIDTPPVGIVTDGIPLIQKVDYPLYILRANVSKKIFIQNINKLNQENHIRKLAILLNGVEVGSTDDYKYGYNYGYGYYDESANEKPSFFKRLFRI